MVTIKDGNALLLLLLLLLLVIAVNSEVTGEGEGLEGGWCAPPVNSE